MLKSVFPHWGHWDIPEQHVKENLIFSVVMYREYTGKVLPHDEQDASLAVTLTVCSMGAGGPSTSCAIQSHTTPFLSTVVI